MPGKGLSVFSEIGKLRKVLVHKPGEELENLTPGLLERLLFDDIPFLQIARQEHDAFCDILRNNGATPVYLVDSLAEVLKDENIRAEFLKEYICEARIKGEGKTKSVTDYLKSFDDMTLLASKLISGIYASEVEKSEILSIADMVDSTYPFLIDPMPNVYFTRDPSAVIGNGFALNSMFTRTRTRETIFVKYLFKHHRDFQSEGGVQFYDRKEPLSIEGGDILVLSDKLIAIGISERTNVLAIERIAKRILTEEQPFRTILAFNIPNRRAFMHLDTVFTMVDRDAFIIHPEIELTLEVFSISSENGHSKFQKEELPLDEILAKYLGIDKVRLIRCGDGHPVTAAREQWNDGSNTLAIAPGEVVVYSRNQVSNKQLEDAGIKIHVMPSSELSRGRGGPRCMSMPLFRESL